MDVGTHLLSGIILAYLFRNNTNWLLIILASELPDLIGELFYQAGRLSIGKKIKVFYDTEISESSKKLGHSAYLIPYNFLHSIFSIMLLLIVSVPTAIVLAYSTHIFLDLISHSRNTWGIMLFWPFSTTRLGSKKDWWQWKWFKSKRVIYFNIVSYSLVFLIYLCLRVFRYG